MSSIGAPPPPPGPAPLPTPVPVGAPLATIANPPIALARLAPGALLNAQVLATLGDGKTTLQTSAGPVNLQSALSLPQSARLQLVVQKAGQEMQLAIIQINGKATGQGTAETAAKPAQQVAVGTASAQSALLAQASATQTATGAVAPLTIGEKALLTLLRPFSPSATSGSQALTPAPVAGASSAPQAATASTASSAPAPSSQASPQTSGQPAQSGTARASGQTSQAGNPVSGQKGQSLPAGSRVEARITGLTTPQGTSSGTPPPQTGQALPNLQAGAALSARVSAVTPDGTAILETRNLVMAARGGGELAVGSRVQLTLESAPALPPTTTAALPLLGDGGLAELAKSWPALREAIQALQAGHPEAAHQLIQALPRADSSLANGLLFFISALRSGDFRSLFNDAVERALNRDRPGLVGKLEKDFQRLKSAREDPREGDWRLSVIPLIGDRTVDQIRLLTRHFGGEDDDEGGGEKGTRFVVDIDLSQLGHLQIDGMVRRRGDKQNLDLVIRSDGPLPQVMRDDIRALFRDAGEVTGVEGQLVFQAQPPNFVEVSLQPSGDDHPQRGLTV